MVDGFYNSVNHNGTGYYFGMVMATYSKNCNKWVFGAKYFQCYYPYGDDRLPIAQFTAAGECFLNLLADHSKTFFCSLGGSALVGYKTMNWDDKKLFDGSTLESSDHYVYGGSVTLELKTYLADHVVLLFTGRERI